MKGKHPIDELVKQTYADRQYPYDPSYWAAAQQLIQEQGPNRKRRFWWMLMSMFLVGCSIVSAAIWSLGFTPVEPVVAMEEWMGVDCDSVMTLSSSVMPLASTDPADISLEKAPAMFHRRQRTASAQDARSGAKTLTEAPVSLAMKTELGSSRGDEPPRTSRTARDEGPGSEESAGIELGDIYRVPSQQLGLGHRLPETNLEMNNLSSKRRIILGVEAGWNLAHGIQRDNQRAESSQTPWVGLRVSMSPARSWKFGTGARYVHRQGLNHDSTYTVRQYDFGFREEEITISPEALHYLEIPIWAQYRIKGHHSIQLGVNPAYLLNVKTSVSQIQRDDFGSGATSSQTGWGGRETFRAWDLGGTIGYVWYAGRGIHLSTSAIGSIQSLTRIGDQGTGLPAGRNVQLRIGLSYDFSRQ
ncbi:outer membrane beta-barrel protein [Pontibacter sp. G13]|uniref:outer membrane beta-barrel protein n=1 Tax=Pontibacter sp. G13 TaxID=3074898 RepID=UPI0028896170|nr:outer membrane beta-barrel protein [Pontibacter sp. G13]WNJ19975.1 outer membrane beta-barrel protein [Pontibacter sp. G13]